MTVGRLRSPRSDQYRIAAPVLAGAACVGSDVDFYSYDKEERQLAKNICKTCPAFAACADHADSNPEWGVWAGKVRFGRVVSPVSGRRSRHYKTLD